MKRSLLNPSNAMPSQNDALTWMQLLHSTNVVLESEDDSLFGRNNKRRRTESDYDFFVLPSELHLPDLLDNDTEDLIATCGSVDIRETEDKSLERSLDDTLTKLLDLVDPMPQQEKKDGFEKPNQVVSLINSVPQVTPGVLLSTEKALADARIKYEQRDHSAAHKGFHFDLDEEQTSLITRRAKLDEALALQTPPRQNRSSR